MAPWSDETNRINEKISGDNYSASEIRRSADTALDLVGANYKHGSPAFFGVIGFGSSHYYLKDASQYDAEIGEIARSRGIPHNDRSRTTVRNLITTAMIS